MFQDIAHIFSRLVFQCDRNSKLARLVETSRLSTNWTKKADEIRYSASDDRPLVIVSVHISSYIFQSLLFLHSFIPIVVMPARTKTRESVTDKDKNTGSSTDQQPAAVTSALQTNDGVSIDCEAGGPTPITKLDKSCGIGNADLKKLQEAGFCTVESIAFAPRKSLLAVKGISDAKADKLAVSASSADERERATSNTLIDWSLETDSHGLHHCHRIPPKTIGNHPTDHRLKGTG